MQACSPFDKESSPKIVHACDLDMTVAQIRRRWPNAPVYGPKRDPYWILADLLDAITEDGGEVTA